MRGVVINVAVGICGHRCNSYNPSLEIEKEVPKRRKEELEVESETWVEFSAKTMMFKIRIWISVPE